MMARPGDADSAGDRLHRRWRGGGLGRLVLVATADLDGDGIPEIVALAGRELKVFDWTGDTYALRHEVTLPKDGLSLTAGHLDRSGLGAVVVGTRDSVHLYTLSGAGFSPLTETLLYPNAYFRSLSLADVNGDGRAEVVAAASGAQTMYVYQVMASGSESRLEELGRVYIGGLVSGTADSFADLPLGELTQGDGADAEGLRRPGRGGSQGQVVAGTKDGFIDVYVPCSLLPTNNQVLYSVKRGDSLWRLARKFGTPLGTIARVNRLTEPYQLTPGQILIIPKKD